RDLLHQPAEEGGLSRSGRARSRNRLVRPDRQAQERWPVFPRIEVQQLCIDWVTLAFCISQTNDIPKVWIMQRTDSLRRNADCDGHPISMRHRPADQRASLTIGKGCHANWMRRIECL